jgi:hypothetical protein
MNATSQRPNGQDEILSKLNMAIEALDRGRWTSSIILAKVLFGSTSDLLAMIRVSFLTARFGRPLADLNRTRWSTERIMLN